MQESKLKAIIENEIRSAHGFVGGETSEDRRKAMEYYHSEKFGNEIEGRSQVVSSDVQDVVETVMPDFMEIFAGGEEVARFEPEGQEDEEPAQQATDYVNFIWNRDNDGFGVTHDWIKDGLLQKNGIIKIYWDESEETKKETISGYNSLQVQELLEDPEVEIAEQETRPPEGEEALYAPDGLIYDLTVKRTRKTGRVKVVGLPPEEFLISRRAVSIDDAAFLCHRVQKTVSELVQMGFSRKVLDQIPSHDEQDFNEERVTRFTNDDEWPVDDDTLDPSMREIWIYECYIRTDYDDDGVAEMRQVYVAGPGYRILSNMEVDDHPFCDLTPIRMPHKFFGRSLADLTFDVQFINSTVWRQMLDNMYFVNNARHFINEDVNIDDWLSQRPGGMVRVSGQGDVRQAAAPAVTAPIIDQTLAVLEYTNQVRETRTGVTRYSQGLDPESLNSTATGTNLLLGRTQMRMLFMARQFAETGFKRAFRKILRLVVNHQDRPRMIRLRNQWVPMDPKSWNADMDVIVTVGLGRGTREQEMVAAQAIMQIQNAIVQHQGGAQGPLVTEEDIYNAAKTFTRAAGFKDHDKYFTDPAEGPRPQPQEPPEIQKAKIEAQSKERQITVQAQTDNQQMQMEHGLKMVEIYLEHQRKMIEMGQELDMERAKHEMEMVSKLGDMAVKKFTAEQQAVTAREKARSTANA